MLIIRIAPLIIFCTAFALVIYLVEPPKSITEAEVLQLILFFIPLFLLTSFALNLLLKFLLRSFIVGLGFMILLILKALDSLNLVTFSLTVLATILLASAFKKKNSYIYQGKFLKAAKLQKQG